MDAWNPPDGGRAPGETSRRAVVRETREETGLRVAITRRVGRYRVPDQRVIVHTFICKRVGGGLRASDEADRIGWFAPRALPASTLPRHAARIADALSADPRLLRRTQ